MQVKWLKRSLDNLNEEAEYLAQDNPPAAQAIVTHVIKSVNQLANLPNLGRAGRVFGTRELIITDFSYIIPYRVKSEVVDILRVFHTSRKWPRNL